MIEESPLVRRPKRHGLGADRVRPTERQIQSNIMVVPKAFLDAHPFLGWNNFRASCLGERVTHKRLDSENRISVPLKGRVRHGQILRLKVDDGVLFIEVEREQP